MVQKQIQIQSIQSLYLEPMFNGQKLGNATGFIAESLHGPVLITNRHVVTGRHQETDKCLLPSAAIPNQISISHNAEGEIGNWIQYTEPLFDENDNQLWYEHPSLGKKADFIALKLTKTDGTELIMHDIGRNDPKIIYQVTDKVSVVGFPFGIRSAGGLAVWATGSIASEPEVDHDGLPILLIDCRSREGQSGSPVLIHRSSSETVCLENGSMINNGIPMSRFLGIYSGRINAESDLGVVWKSKALIELVDSIQ
jgi:hypothetical protein